MRVPLGKGVAALLVVATLVTFLAFISLWLNRQVFQTSYWTDTSTELLESQQVRDQLSNYMVEQLFANVDVQGELQQQLPPEFKVLAGPATAGMRQLAGQAADKVLASPKFQALWEDANRRAHTVFIKVLDGGGTVVSTNQGVVTLNLSELLDQVAAQTGVGEKLVAKIPAGAGQLEVLDSDNLELAENVKSFSDGTAVWLPILALLLYAAAIGLAAGRRRRVVRAAGISWIAIAVFIFIAINLGEGPFVSSLAATAAAEPAVTDVYGIATKLLHSMATSILLTGILVVAAAWLMGPSRYATAVRRMDAPYLREYPIATAAGAAVAYLILIWWAPTIGFRTTSGLLINTLLVVSGFIAYRQLTVKEFPDEPVPAVGDWMREQWASVRSAVEGRRGGAFPVSRKGVGATETMDQIERLADLRERGILTDDEFDTQKTTLLAHQAGRD